MDYQAFTCDCCNRMKYLLWLFKLITAQAKTDSATC